VLKAESARPSPVSSIWLRPRAALGSIGCRFGFESSYAAADVPPSITPLTADRMKYVDLNVHDLIAGVFYSRILSPDMAL
jgi:hypothetical protein